MNALNRYVTGFACVRLAMVYAAFGAEQGQIALLQAPFNLAALYDADRIPASFEPRVSPDITGSKSPEAAPAGHGESLFSFTYLELVANDVKETFTAPVSWGTSEWLAFSGVAAGLAGLTFFDSQIHEAVQDNRSRALDDVCRAIQPFGAEYSFGVLGTLYIGGEILQDQRARATALDGLSASLISGLLIAEPLKYTVGRARPSQGPADHFAPFSTDQSFPSGHATQAFTVATVISEHYDSLWVRAFSYGLAGMVGFARMEQDAHWASDVAAGAVIGAFVGHVVVRYNEKQRAIRLEPVTGPGVEAVQLSFSF